MLQFRNVDADPSDPVETWPYEALVTAVERGSVADWSRIDGALRAAPWGRTARDLDAYLAYADPEEGATTLMRLLVDRARQRAEASERDEVAAEVRRLITKSGLSRRAFASAIGSSASRLSTYATGRVTPSAALLVRMRRVPRRRA